MSKVSGLGHVGLFVKDTEVMKEFYTDFMGMTLTDRADDDFIMFFSSRPDDEHHELALLRRPDTPSSVQQVSFTVDTLADLKDFWRRIKERNLTVNMVVNHGNAFGCYFQDPGAQQRRGVLEDGQGRAPAPCRPDQPRPVGRGTDGHPGRHAREVDGRPAAGFERGRGPDATAPRPGRACHPERGCRGACR